MQKEQITAGRPRILTAPQEAELVVWYRSTRTVREKAKELGLSETGVRRILARHGIGPKTKTHKEKLMAAVEELGAQE